MGWGTKFVDDISSGFDNYGALRTPTEMIFEVDREPVAALVTNNAVKGPHRCRFFQRAYLCRHTGPSGGHDMVVKPPRILLCNSGLTQFGHLKMGMDSQCESIDTQS